MRCLITPGETDALPWEDGPELVEGTLLDEDVLFKAVTGVHVIFHLANAQWWGRPRELERIELVGTRNLIVAARAARVGRIISLSHLGAAPSSAYPLLQIKGLVEETIRDSGLAYTIIRSALVFGEDDSFLNHIAMTLRANPVFFLMPGRGEVVLQPIYIDDLIEVLLRSLERLEVVDTLVEIGGPEYITLQDLIRTIMRVTRMSRLIIPVPPYILRWTSAIYSRILAAFLDNTAMVGYSRGQSGDSVGQYISIFRGSSSPSGGHAADLYARSELLAAAAAQFASPPPTRDLAW